MNEHTIDTEPKRRFQFAISTVLTCTATLAVAFALLRMVIPYEGVLASQTPGWVPYVTIGMYCALGSTIGIAMSAFRSKRFIRGAIVGSLLPLAYFAIFWLVINAF